MERLELGISGFTPRLERAKDKCPTHPYCNIGGCGFFTGYPHGEGPDTPKIVAIQQGFDDKMEKSDVVIYSNKMMETSVMARLRSHEIKPIVA